VLQKALPVAWGLCADPHSRTGHASRARQLCHFLLSVLSKSPNLSEPVSSAAERDYDPHLTGCSEDSHEYKVLDTWQILKKKKKRARVGVGSPENLVDHVPCLGPSPSGCSAHRPFCLGPDTRFEPCLPPHSSSFRAFFSVGSYFVRLLTCLTWGCLNCTPPIP